MTQITGIKLPQYVPFPVTVSSVVCRPGQTIAKHKPLFTYKYWDYQDDPNSKEDPPTKIRVERIGTYESPIEGEVLEIHVNVGEEVAHGAIEVLSIKEACDHAVQYGGLCALCGKAVEDEKDYTGYSYEDRAQIEMSHDNTGLKISFDEAAKIEQNTTDQLSNDKKLILVVDLDQTVIHATVDPTVGEWQRDPENPNYQSVKDVQSFCLEEEPIMPPGWTGPKFAPTKCWYYVKLRPGLQKFLQEISKLYELHIYTMATRNYALAIAHIIDPTEEYFGDRILSRDESGSLTHKNLKRLFPVDQSMVAIIDDRGDVWKWESNLVKVVPYDFFVGIGDINSSFLPKKNGQIMGPTKKRKSIAKLERMEEEKLEEEEKLKQKKKLEEEGGEEKTGEGNDPKKEDEEENETDSHSPVDRILELGGGEDNANLLLEQSLTRSNAIEQQQHDRPLAKLQHDLEKIQHPDGIKNDEDNSEASNDEANETRDENLLYDDDTELYSLENALKKIHSKYYEILEKNELENLNLKPDLTLIIPALKHKCLEGVVVLFSGILPLGINLDRADIVIWCRQFGVKVVSEVFPEVTHVVCRDNRTKNYNVGPTFKVRVAKKLIPNVKIVNPDWLFACLSSWSKVDETEYLIDSNDEDWKVNPRDIKKYQDVLAKHRENQEVDDGFGISVDYSLDGVDAEVDDFLAGTSDDDDDEDDEDDDEVDEDDDKMEEDENNEGGIERVVETPIRDEAFEGEEKRNGILKRTLSDSEDEIESSTKRQKQDKEETKKVEEEEEEEEVDLDELEQELLDGFDDLEETV